MDFDIRADGMVVVSLLRRGRRPHNAWPAENRAGHEEAEMTDEQIEAAAAAYDDALMGAGDSHRLSIRAALEAAERVAWCDDMSKAPSGPHLRGLWVNHSPSKTSYWDVVAGFVDDDGDFLTMSGDDSGWRAEDYERWAPLPKDPPR